MWTLSQDITGLLLAFKIKINIHKSLIYLITYLWVQRNIQTWNNCRVKTAYCCGLRTWIFGQTLWTDAVESLTIHTLLLAVRHGHATLRAGHPRSSPAPPPAVAVISFNREDVESVASLRLMSPGHKWWCHSI